ALDEYADGVATLFVRQPPGGSADSTLELVADHACAPADVALRHRPTPSRVQRAKGVLRMHMESIGVVQPAIPSLRYHGQRPPVLGLFRLAVFHAPCDDGIAHYPHAMGVGDHHRAFQEARLLYPGGAGHFSIAVFREPA